MVDRCSIGFLAEVVKIADLRQSGVAFEVVVVLTGRLHQTRAPQSLDRNFRPMPPEISDLKALVVEPVEPGELLTIVASLAGSIDRK